jgi:hypothetical protein
MRPGKEPTLKAGYKIIENKFPKEVPGGGARIRIALQAD